MLGDLDVLVLDCQAGGATPAYGDLLEIGWARVTASGTPSIHAHWIVPRTDRNVPRPIRELTGWSEEHIAESIPEVDAWRAVAAEAARMTPFPAPTVIHYARFELPFLRDLHARLGEGP